LLAAVAVVVLFAVAVVVLADIVPRFKANCPAVTVLLNQRLRFLSAPLTL